MFYNIKKENFLEIMMVMYKNYMGCKTRYIRRVNVIKTINGNVYPLVLFLVKFFCVRSKIQMGCFYLNATCFMMMFCCKIVLVKNTNTASQVLLYIVNIEKMKNNIVLEISFEWFTMSSWRVFQQQINDSFWNVWVALYSSYSLLQESVDK